MSIFDSLSKAVPIVSGIGDWVEGSLLGGNEADAIKKAAGVQSDYQNRALDYQMDQESLPSQFREGAMTQLAGLAGLEGGEGNQQGLINQAMASPLYAAIMSGQETGDRNIAKNASVTGMRGGNLSGEMSDYAMQLENKALMDSYNQQVGNLQGMAGLPSNTNNIANTMSGIGTTQAQGITGAAQARSNAMGNIIGAGTSLIPMAFGAPTGI